MFLFLEILSMSDSLNSWEPLDLRVDVLLTINDSDLTYTTKIYDMLHPLFRE